MKNARREGIHIYESGLPDVYWQIDCSCRDDGPWLILGPCGDSYFCTRCNQQMQFREVPVKPRRRRKKSPPPTVEQLDWQLKQEEFNITDMKYKDKT